MATLEATDIYIDATANLSSYTDRYDKFTITLGALDKGQYKYEVTENPTSYEAGDTLQGGLYTFTDSGFGYITAASDQSTTAPWGCQGTTIAGLQIDIGTGPANTALIVAGCATAGIAARIANDLTLNGFSDWFLPSLDELSLIYNELASKGIGGFSTHSYWSSTQEDDSNALTVNMNNGGVNGHNKDQTNRHTRAARYYTIGTAAFPVAPTIYVNSSTATVVTYPSPPVESPTFYLEQPRTESVDNISVDVGVGAYFQGGIVVTYNQSTGAGTICTLEDISGDMGIEWGTEGVSITGANSNTNGQQNTTSILAQDPLRPIAASICNDLVINGYGGWFLPAPFQLGLMYTNLHLNGLGNFSTIIPYWSSRQSDDTNAVTFDFSDGTTPGAAKSDPYLVRAMRSFTYLPTPQVNLIVSQ